MDQDINEVTLDDNLSPDVDQGEVVNPEEAMLDLAMSMLEERPSELVEEADATEVSEEETEAEEAEEEQESSDDETPDVEEADDEADDAEVGDEEEDVSDLPVVDYDEAKKFQFEIGGKNYSVAQLKSFIGQADAVSKAQEEVKAQQEKLAVRDREQEQFHQFLQTSAATATQRQHLQQLAAAYAGLQRQMQSVPDADPDRANKRDDIRQQMDQLSHQYNVVEAQVKQAEDQISEEKWNRQVTTLNEKGYGDLLTDESRFNAVSSFGEEVLDPEAFEFFKTNATAMIVLEMARTGKGAAKPAKGKLQKNKPLPVGRKANQQAVSGKKDQELRARARAGRIDDNEAAAMRQSLVQDLLS